MSENHEYLSQGGDWAQIVDEAAELERGAREAALHLAVLVDGDLGDVAAVVAVRDEGGFYYISVEVEVVEGGFGVFSHLFLLGFGCCSG